MPERIIRVLHIGKRVSILKKLTEACIEYGFHASWTNQLKQIEVITATYQASDYDVITFEQDINTETKEKLMIRFTKQNPQIKSITRLAEMPSLVIDQVQQLFRSDQHGLHIERIAPNQIELANQKSCHIIVKHYWVNWLYQKKEAILLNLEVDKGEMTVAWPDKSKQSYISIVVDDQVVEVLS
ncbi:hypothetical protein [Amphibacillus cookii]|uniref:hypothetical protein n=1 Tax=Amphibacillus cookii TaxID=767787 RepID=UPI00195805CA|nr:hypothetical protein [Amphibacillus cookii]MBM7541977.1 hypothetical protein [Amphibacillus cookii]